ncbi:uncharacterized protein LAESUDRAFT_643540 [Laetiporus sulphureus 93-53]|uniref:Zn(2)-C6 fungal-type domain-containing protein n=1 Tax=Laetiporus sulphureus 93-53 TaxID=1314785 RepID=A0A165GNH6_9APHY|nr:uncharacterized protein LAESUDRAFT_643540 [Laetiporus sulphureus 93-53]KZT10591.1 hypothetical protein LAESUDRAFT_643540 [Laetiporus sulphureus 93-53]
MSSKLVESTISLNSSTSTTDVQGTIEVKRDGISSRIRRHKGNVPSVPQTKLCPICPAKFTRTTHLSRHIRTHTREKLHECDRCHSQFTRSDLLTRHKRSCSDQGHVNRSRRRSCQACADSKVKCDLQQPCSKCRNRSRDCIYVNGAPAASGSRAVKQQMLDIGDLLAGPLAMADSSLLVATSPGSSGSSSGQDDCLRAFAMQDDRDDFSLGPAFPSFVSTGSVDFMIDSSSMFALIDQQILPPENMSGDPFASEMFDGLFDNIFNSSHQMFPSSYSDRTRSDESLPELHPYIPFSTNVDKTLLPSHLFNNRDITSIQSTPGNSYGASLSSTSSVSNSPSSADLQSYLNLFFSAYLPNMPIIHSATFKFEGKSPLLLAAMQACGALYVKTRAADQFISSVLAKARDELIVEFGKESVDWERQIELILAVDLLQTLGLFHQTSKQRTLSTVYHGVLTMMIRLSDFGEQISKWTAPETIDPSALDRLWRDWAVRETAKRALTFSYLHDGCHCLYYDLRPTYVTSEFDIDLPCENALWAATTAEEWLSILQKPSPYGKISERLRGPSLQGTYARLENAGDSLHPAPVLSPFAHFVVIHAILRQFFEEDIESRLSGVATDGDAFLEHANRISEKRLWALQATLHNWLQSWLGSPDSPPYSDGVPRFLEQALTYYWIAQIAIMAYRERLPPFCRRTYLMSGEAKFCLIKKWEMHVREFLHSGAKEPTLFLEEFVKVRLKKLSSGVLQEPGVGEWAGLLGFFSDT